MLSAVMEGHRSFQPVIDAIIQLAEHAAKEPLPLTEPPEAAKTVAETLKAEMRGKMVEAYAETQKLARQTKVGAVKAEAKKLFEGDEAATGRVRRAVRQPRGRRRARRHPRHRQAHRRPRHQDGPSDRGRGRRAAARPRLVAVHPRRDPGAGRGHARHRPGRADHRRARGRVPRALHAALQHASVRGRRSAPHGLARPSRDRPRQARLARAAPDAAGQGEVPLHDPHRVGDHREQRLLVDGLGLRRLAVADGCRRADGAAGGGHRHGPDQGRRALRRAVRHPGRRGSSRRHGLQGRRHRSRHHLRCRWTSRSPRSPRRS